MLENQAFEHEFEIFICHMFYRSLLRMFLLLSFTHVSSFSSLLNIRFFLVCLLFTQFNFFTSFAHVSSVLIFAQNSSSLIRLLSNSFLLCWFFFLQMFLPCVVFYKTYFIHSRHLHNIFLPCSFKKKGSCYFLLAVYTHYIIRLHNMFLPCKFR